MSEYEEMKKSEKNTARKPSASSAVQRKPGTEKANLTGIPSAAKERYENLSGFSMDDVRVHYQSSLPQKVGALAYTQGTNVYMGPGQEKHLNHELWHVVQQKQGRVTATSSVGGLPLNDSAALEAEADRMR